MPAVLEMTLYTLVWVLDTMMVGKYGGKITVSAVSLSSEIMYTFINILVAIGISVGVTSLVARRVGAKKFKEAEEYASLSVVATAIIAIILSSIFFIFPREILSLFKAKGQTLELGIKYMKICSIGLFFNMNLSTLNGILRGIGNTIIPFVTASIVVIVNLTLDYSMIFGKFGFPELGVEGAALATSIAHFVGFLFAAYYIKVHSKIKPRVKYILSMNGRKLWDLIRLSVPSGMQEGAFSICRLVNAGMIMTLGEVAFSANQITTTLESLSFMPGWGFAVAATSLVGHKVGQKDYEGAKEYASASIILGSLIMLICGVLFLLFPKQIVSPFIKSSETEVIRLGALCLMIASIEQVPMAISMIIGGTLKGMGDTKRPFFVSLFSNWVIRFPLMYYFIYVKKFPVTAVWWITAIQWGIDAILIYLLYKHKFAKLLSKKWTKNAY
ncbi:MATE family efflux transporter [Oceanirhabdus sp. W0125-5]|uniref:MATE family efflux transporter n=1 Tax=Oceanirhabdus sp. W0125-5 TaxID=2999116 RepID=UPI003FA59415